MTLRLKQLEIHGFKSFANATTFAFDRGITAIVGPNGSGKSNVAEALRWVLGEQGHANLRSRRTEDVIFAGSDRRAALGMAEVILTLDNADGDLPLPFSEVTIARRAFRGGENQGQNQYLVNGGRVRLKDVQQLVAPLGQAYTIIGQGLVDAALSQRPEERRGLFEHAAGIGGLRLRANEAERGLAEAMSNAERLRDILGELEPRVRSLERSARLAREYGAVRERLRVLLLQDYGRQWHASRGRISDARAALRVADGDLTGTETEHERASRALGALRGDERRLAEEARQVGAALADAERSLADERHRRDLLDAATRATAQRLADLHTARDDLLEQQNELRTECERLRAGVAEVVAALEDAGRRLAEAERVEAEEQARRSRLERELDAIERRIIDLSRERAQAEGVLAAAGERLAALDAEQARHSTVTADTEAQRDSVRADMAEIAGRRLALAAEIESAMAESRVAGAQLAAARERAVEQQRAIEGRERELSGLQARHDALERTHANGEGFYAGVRAVLRAARDGSLDLPGLLGTLAELIEAPAEVETAIEVALGGHLHDIVIETWDDARIAIAYLKRSGAGRATFQPLDTVRGVRRSPAPSGDSGIVGAALELMRHDERITGVLEQTLGRTLVVTDLDASRRLLSAAPGWTLVTLAGEISRPSGSVTGGARVAESGLLARERERRALPAEIARTRGELDELRVQSEAGADAVAVLVRQLDTLTARLEGLRLESRGCEADQARASRELDSLERARTAHALAAREFDARRGEVESGRNAAVARIESLSEELETAGAERDRLTPLVRSPTETATPAAGLRVEIAGLRERQAALEAAQRRAEQRLAQIEAALSQRRSEIERLSAADAGAAADRLELSAVIADGESAVDSYRAALPPLEARRAELAELVAAGERELDRLTGLLREAERERDRASLVLARCQDEQVFLAERIRGDLDIDDPDTLEAPGAGLGDDAGGAEPEIQRLRERLRRMSVVGDDVLEQFEHESARLEFLSREIEDVDQAATGLRRVLTELNTRMGQRFEETFREVAAAFELTFARLFGGGSARLVMQTADDGSTAIDIVAQPPGKRLSGLNALSGGERALTAVALLIAIQRVNPSPFCLLDEVDAALDESNVLRFRDELRDLAGTTQFVVITHNRGTIEGADALYGVTMGDDSVSRVISLRLDDAIRDVEARQLARSVEG